MRRYETETIKFMAGEPDQVLAVGFASESLAPKQLPAHLAGRFLKALNEFGAAMGAAFALRSLRFGSAILDFVPDRSESALRLGDSADQWSGARETAAAAQLAELAAASRDPERVLGTLRELGEDAGNAFLALIDVLIDENVDAEILARDRPRALIRRRSAEDMRTALRREREASVERMTVTGRLYLANAKAKTFRLEPDGGGRKILGNYPPNLEGRVGLMWSKRVIATVQVTELELERSGKRRRRYMLAGIKRARGELDV